MPAYKRLLKEKGVSPCSIKDIATFKRFAPIINKDIFSKYDIADLCLGGKLDKMKTAFLSSGFSNNFSYSVLNNNELGGAGFMCDTMLDHSFDISKKRTFWISALGMGVKVYTNIIPLAETSVRPDMVLALVKKFSKYFEQLIIIGNVFFIKEVIEDGIDRGINWKDKRVNFIIGEDWFPENYRTYLLHLIGENNIVMANFGISELGPSLFSESPCTIRIRQLAEKNPAFRSDLFGKGTDICPELLHHHSFQTFLEEIDGEFAFTTLNPKATIPLIRYNSEDEGKIYPYDQLRKILTKNNYQNYAPRLKLPVVSLMGRKDKFIELNNVFFTPEQVKTGIYNDFESAAATTGYFRMSKPENRLRIEIQLKEKREATRGLENIFYQNIAKYIKSDFELLLYPYIEFPYGIGLIYEKKFKYI